MNTEQLEHELCLLNNKIVIVVRPGFGQQSDSWMGHLVSDNSYPRKFTFSSSNDLVMIFFAEDVMKLDNSKSEDVEKIVRLKGPNDYAKTYSEITH